MLVEIMELYVCVVAASSPQAEVEFHKKILCLYNQINLLQRHIAQCMTLDGTEKSHEWDSDVI